MYNFWHDHCWSCVNSCRRSSRADAESECAVSEHHLVPQLSRDAVHATTRFGSEAVVLDAF